jgi:hypothetical protein
VAGRGVQQRGMEEAPENVKELLHSAHASGMNEEVYYELKTSLQ